MNPLLSEMIVVAAGGAVGSGLRFLTSKKLSEMVTSTFPYPILVVNIIGCLVMGMLAGFFIKHTASNELRLFLTVGVMGGYTTFSSFALDTMILVERGDMKTAAVYVVSSVTLSIIAFAAGMFAIRVS